MINKVKINRPCRIIGTNKRALYNPIGDKQYLQPNCVYSVNVNLNNTDYKYCFTSSYFPLYSNIETINIGLGNILNDYLTDDDILHIIRDNSIYLDNNIKKDYKYQLDKQGNEIIPDIKMKQWTKVKSQIDCIYAVYTSIASNLGMESKKVGSVKIFKSTRLPSIDDLIKNFKQDLANLEVNLFD